MLIGTVALGRCGRTGELDRLRRALDLWEIINRNYLPEGVSHLKTRALSATIDLLATYAAEQTA